MWRLLLFALMSSLVITCTNLDFRQDMKRFEESTNGSLPPPLNIDPSGDNQFSFAAFGDCHIGMSDATEGYLQTALQRISADSSLSFVLGLGDLVNTGRAEQYDSLREKLNAFASLRFYGVIGNHDIYFNGWENYKNNFGPSLYTFSADSLRFIIVDDANSTLSEAVFQWLEERLRLYKNEPVVVAMHIPFYPVAHSDFFQLDDPQQGYRLMRLMKDYNVDLVLQGHYHGFRDDIWEGTRYIISGGLNSELDEGVVHYLKISFDGSSLNVQKAPL